jgi:hypothetical protein
MDRKKCPRKKRLTSSIYSEITVIFSVQKTKNPLTNQEVIVLPF